MRFISRFSHRYYTIMERIQLYCGLLAIRRLGFQRLI